MPCRKQDTYGIHEKRVQRHKGPGIREKYRKSIVKCGNRKEMLDMIMYWISRGGEIE